MGTSSRRRRSPAGSGRSFRSLPWRRGGSSPRTRWPPGWWRARALASGRKSVLATTAKGYVLDTDAVRVDLRDFRKLVATASSGSAADVVSATAAALDLVRGELLVEEPYAAWAVRARDEFTRTLVAACAHAAQLANAIGDFEQADRLARRAV